MAPNTVKSTSGILTFFAAGLCLYPRSTIGFFDGFFFVQIGCKKTDVDLIMTKLSEFNIKQLNYGYLIYFNFKSPLPNPSGFDIAINFLDVIRG